MFTRLIIEIRIFACLMTCRGYAHQYTGRFYVAVSLVAMGYSSVRRLFSLISLSVYVSGYAAIDIALIMIQ